MKPVSPVAAKQGELIKVKASARCSCDKQRYGAPKINPTCPVHGHGRPAGRV